MKKLERVHKFTMIAKHQFSIGGGNDCLNELCVNAEEVGDDPHDHMSISIGGNYYRSEAVLAALDDLRMKAMLHSTTSSDSLLMIMLKDAQVIDAYGVLIQGN